MNRNSKFDHNNSKVEIKLLEKIKRGPKDKTQLIGKDKIV